MPWVREGASEPEVVADAARWDRELGAHASPAPLNQSWAWGEVQSNAGWKTHRLSFPGIGPAAVQVLENGPLSWGFVPRGPVACTEEMLGALAAWARSNGLARIRVEPERDPSVRPALEALQFERVQDVEPSHTRIFPLASDAEMLASFGRSTRYNIRYAERHGVAVECGADAAALAHHVAASASRAGVNLPGVRYLKLVLDTLPDSRTFVARHEGDSLCALMVAVHDGRGYYLYSGADGRKRNLKAMDLAMWEGIRYAASKGCRDFDLWGIAPDDDPKHPWHGFTEFKRGFGGCEVEYAGTWDLVLSKTRSAAIEAHDRVLKTMRRLRSR